MIRVILLLCIAFSAFADYPHWLKFGVKVITEFDVRDKIFYKEGYGIIINDGLVLSSASLVYANERPKDIILYHTEALGEPIECLSHAKILAIDDSLDLAVLEAEQFTDIYCNILPTPNFRALIFKESYLHFLTAPLDLPLNETLEISYFKEHDWSQFLRQKASLRDFLDLKNEESLLGMPLFVENEFLALSIKPLKTSLKKNLKLGILTHREILEFLCKITRETSVFKNRQDLEAFCGFSLGLRDKKD